MVEDPGFGLMQTLQWWIQGLGSYRFYSGESRIWTHTDPTVMDPGFWTHADSTVVDPGFGLIQLL